MILIQLFFSGVLPKDNITSKQLGGYEANSKNYQQNEKLDEYDLDS